MTDIFVFEKSNVREATAGSTLEKYNVCAIVFRGCTNVTAICGMLALHVMAIRFDMGLHCTPKRSKWHYVLIKRVMVVDIGGDF